MMPVPFALQCKQCRRKERENGDLLVYQKSRRKRTHMNLNKKGERKCRRFQFGSLNTQPALGNCTPDTGGVWMCLPVLVTDSRQNSLPGEKENVGKSLNKIAKE